MLVQAFSASAFGLRGRILMEAAQTNVYHAPASHASIMRSIRLPITHSLAKKRGAPMPPSKASACTRRTNVQKQGATMRDEKRQRSARCARHT